jgi:hypothetical protein
MPTVIAAPVQTVAILRAATDWTCLGMVTSSKFPCPKRPFSPLPQVKSLPSSQMNAECSHPHATCGAHYQCIYIYILLYVEYLEYTEYIEYKQPHATTRRFTSIRFTFHIHIRLTSDSRQSHSRFTSHLHHIKGQELALITDECRVLPSTRHLRQIHTQIHQIHHIHITFTFTSNSYHIHVTFTSHLHHIYITLKVKRLPCSQTNAECSHPHAT